MNTDINSRRWTARLGRDVQAHAAAAAARGARGGLADRRGLHRGVNAGRPALTACSWPGP
ncbi:hypothetical protein QJS66_15190 [Kocuria rhizophila]|nr:hypothetical protein QJS66_15190 [Kocuria rhizophila]